ncbi:hypothetical protein F8568_015695 [Actinomadura sp. LD22]|uniref:HEAT repeat domain-containing protein n=1 Tax=Actinomadura physcomitrii TaxID=2650748 RepID=A0A6I4MGQ3_9ACTN|nr:hypothetical protein [Actinomadura physcomitrii]MWA01789.1 hypothetical protein [Actinomadura physcomitrii]
MRADELLTEVEPLPFAERCRRLADLRGRAGAPELAELLGKLADRGHYERSLGLFIASAVRDEASLAHIARAMRDTDAELACWAIRLAVRHGTGPEPFLAGLDDAPAAIRAQIYEAVRKWRRTDLADALAGPVADRWGVEEAAALLPACGAEVVAERIDAAERAVPNWASLGRAHPGVMLDHAERRLAPPGTRAERVERVVAKDASAVAIPAVLAAIARERTDLLHLVLGGTTPPGRFQRPDVTYVPHMTAAWMRRWTSRQREAYLRLLARVAGDEQQPGDERARAIRTIGTVPGVDAARLRPYLDSGDDRILRTALTAIAWTASPQAVLPDLLAHAATDHAHVAMYASTRAARFVKPSELAALPVPALREGKITARKEALRILLHNRVPDALDLIAAAWDDPGQHRDVRAAIASALRPYLAEPVARRILTEAAGGPRDLARQVLGTPPLAVEERFRGFYASLVMRVARSGDTEARDAALPNVPQWAQWAPDAPAMLAGLVTGLGASPSWRPALEALVGCAVAGFGAAELGAAAAELTAAPDEPSAGAERDLPAFQRLSALVDAVRDAAKRDRDTAERAIAALDGCLPRDLACELAAATLRWDAPGTATALDALADRCTGGVLATQRVAEALVAWADERWLRFAKYARLPAGTPDPETVLPHAERLAARGDLAGGLFAAALAGGHAPRAGWSEPWRALLRALRAHPVPDVAYTARRIHTADE